MVVACVVAFFGAVPLVASLPYLVPVLLIPVGLGLWAWRAGTDATAEGLRVRALFGSRLIPWGDVEALVPVGDRQVYAVLADNRRVRLTAVSAADLAALREPEQADQPELSDQPEQPGQ